MKRFVFFMVMALLGAVGFASCNGNDEDYADVDLSTYILGSWHSYKLTVYGGGESVTADITKNNEYSVSYLEMNFLEDGKVITSGWLTNNDGTSQWASDTDSYKVVENTVKIMEYTGGVDTEWNNGISFNSSLGDATRSGESSEIVSLVFDPTSRDLYVRVSQKINGIDVVGYLYLKK